jgi:hypothetical protein
MAPGWCFSYQPTSNYSYLKNSNFIGNYALEVGGKLNSELLHSNALASLIAESDLSLTIDLYHLNAGVLKYGVRINPSLSSYSASSMDYHLFINGRLGKIEIGATPSAAENLKIRATPLSLGAGTVGSSFGRHIKFPLDSGHLLFEPTTLASQNFGFVDGQSIKKSWNHSKYLNKINYYSPELFGFQLGLSLTPNAVLTDVELGFDTENRFDFGYILSGAMNFIETLWDVALAASMVFESNITDPARKIPLWGRIDTEDHSLAAKLNSYEFGLSFSYFGVTIAASLGHVDRAPNEGLKISVDNVEKISGWYGTGGGSYEIGSLLMSVVYSETRLDSGTTLKTFDYGIRKSIARNMAYYVRYIDYRYRFESQGFTKEFGVGTGIVISF